MRNQIWKYIFVNLENTKLNLKINQSQATCLFLYTPWKYQKSGNFLFSGGKEKDQWREIDYEE